MTLADVTWLCTTHLHLLHQLLPNGFGGRRELVQLGNKVLHPIQSCICVCAARLLSTTVLQQLGNLLPRTSNIGAHACQVQRVTSELLCALHIAWV
jgi:hypothetical protein